MKLLSFTSKMKCFRIAVCFVLCLPVNKCEAGHMDVEINRQRIDGDGQSQPISAIKRRKRIKKQFSDQDLYRIKQNEL